MGKTFLIILIISLLLIIGTVLLVIYFYNGLIYKKNQVDNAFSSVDVQLQKRWNLIPNLIGVAEQYMQFEQKTLTEIARLRTQLISERVNANTRLELENQISSALGSLFIAVESYPNLKTNDHFMRLQLSLNEVEEQISAARRFYNSAVTEYNAALDMFPTNLFASGLDYQRKNQFQATDGERQNINVRSLFNQ
jgi:LemA protein